MMDIEALKKRLEQKQEIDCGITRGFREKYPPLGSALYDMRAVEDAMATIDRLTVQNAALKAQLGLPNETITTVFGVPIDEIPGMLDQVKSLQRELEEARNVALQEAAALVEAGRMANVILPSDHSIGWNEALTRAARALRNAADSGIAKVET